MFNNMDSMSTENQLNMFLNVTDAHNYINVPKYFISLQVERYLI